MFSPATQAPGAASVLEMIVNPEREKTESY